MSTKLRLLLDECLQREIADQIKTSNAINVQWVNEIPALRNRSFTYEDLVEYARRTRRIVVTVEGRLNERKYEICTHPGIIVFEARKRHESVKAQIFKKFMLSGHRSKSNHAVTYLRLTDATIRIKRADGTLGEIPVKL